MKNLVSASLAALSLSLIFTPFAQAEKVSVLSPSKLISGESGPGKTTLLQQGRVQTRYFIPKKTSVWQKNHDNGIHALDQRRFGLAERLLLAAIKSTKGPMTNRSNLVDSRLALGRLYLTQDRYPEAYNVYRSTLPRAKSANGHNSFEVAECFYGLAKSQLHFGELSKARDSAEKSVEILKKLDKTDCQLFGRSLNTLGMVMAEFGWYEDSKKFFKPALAIMNTYPGYKKLDLADVLREQSLFFHRIGLKKEATRLYEQSYSIREKFVQPTKAPSVVGQVRFVWEEGSTRSKEIIDNEFPFRFLSANGVRVAATVIDLWELLGVLVTVTNTTEKRRALDLGKVQLLKLNLKTPKRKVLQIPSIDPESIDRVQKELSIWSLTHTRPWLANIQKTRTARGFVPSKGHDLFRGPNVFGVYGKWKAVSHTVPKRVGLLPSREKVLQTPENYMEQLPGLLVKGNNRVKDVFPVWLEPFESRTGELFYLNPRDCDVVVKVPVGNAVFEIPFHTRKKFPH